MKKLALAALLLFAACRSGEPPILLPHPAPENKGLERDRWFYEMRAYPFDEIPADGRRNALEFVNRRAEDLVNATDPAQTMVWKPLGPMPVQTNWPWAAATGRVKALAISPANPNLILSGASGGGIWRSTDGGRHFAPVSDTQADLAVGAIAFAPSNPNIVYAAMGSEFLGTGVLRSDDAGATWRHVSDNTFGTRGQSPRIVVDPADANRVWVAQYSRLDTAGVTRSSGVLFSSNGGVTWKNQLAGLIGDLIALPGSGTTLYAGMYRLDNNGGNGGIYRTTNGGTTWSLLYDLGTNNAGFIRLGISAANPSRIYAHVSASGAQGDTLRMIVSENGGTSWTNALGVGLPSETPVYVAADPSNANVVYAGMRDLYKSNDRGMSFVNLTKGYTDAGRFDPRNSTSHVDQHAIAFHPPDARTLYIGNDGGVFLSTDAGVTYESLSGTLSLVQAYGIDAHPTDPHSIFLGTQDNGLERRDANGTWRELITGDYGSVVFDANAPDTIATNYVYGLIMAFTQRGSVYRETLATNDTFGESDDRPRISFIAPFEQRNGTLYFGTYRLFISRDFGRIWDAPAGTYDLTKNTTDRLSAIGVSANGRTIYTGSQRGRVMVSRDEGASWREVTATLPNRAVRAIAVDAANPDVAYIGYSGYVTDHVFRTRDGGASWENLNNGLPDIPVNALLMHGGYVYAGTDIGVFRYDGGAWTYYSNGMPPVMVMDFDVNANGVILAATHGRGAYQLVPQTSTQKRRSARH